MAKKGISREKIINAFLFCAFDKSAGSTSLQDIADSIQIKKASMYNHFKSKDDMYEATLLYCSDYLNAFNFLPENLLEDGKIFDESAQETFKKIIRRYVQLYEAEPLFQIYTFIHTEKYFNSRASAIADKEFSKIESGIAILLKGFSSRGKLECLSVEEIKDLSNWLASFLFQQLDLYITHKKETVRQNPESGVGSLFALPTDNTALGKIIDTVTKWLIPLIPNSHHF
ncbi:MAG: TetR/AcrR family transcriptional regulator [Treponema sp.]|nr:TetR/AcrR family transcriptional regulator [Treponema sp.]